MRDPGFIVHDLGTGKIQIFCAAVLAARYDYFQEELGEDAMMASALDVEHTTPEYRRMRDGVPGRLPAMPLGDF